MKGAVKSNHTKFRDVSVVTEIIAMYLISGIASSYFSIASHKMMTSV